MIERTKAIVLNKVKYGDSDIIVNLLSYKHGRISVIVKSCRNKKSHVKTNIFFPLNIIETDIYVKQNRNLQTIKNAASVEILNSISSNIFKICIAQFLVELIQKSIKEESRIDDIFSFIENSILKLEKDETNTGSFHLYFLIELAKYLGFDLNNNFDNDNQYFNIREGMFIHLYTCEEESLNKTESETLYNILMSNFDNNSQFEIPLGMRRKLLQKIVRYYQYHIIHKQEIKSLAVLNDIFEA